MVPRDRQSAVDDLSCEQAFDTPPSSRKVGVVLRQSQDRMQMIGKDNNGVDHEWPLLTGDAKGVAERTDVLDQNGGASIGDRNGEKEGPPGNEASPIVHHRRSLSRIALRSIRATVVTGSHFPSSSSTASAKICGSSCGRLWPARGINRR